MSDAHAESRAEPPDAVPARILIAEDEKHLAILLESFLSGRGHRVTVVHDGRDALASLAAEPFEVALLDVQMPGLDGLAVLRGARDLPLPPQVVVMTGNGTVETALAAMRAGAYDYVAKPYRMAEVDLLVRRAAERRRLEQESVAARSRGDDPLVTRYAPLRAVVEAVERAAPSLGAMLLAGEPGTGRSLLARRAHQLAGGGPLVELDATDAPAADGREVERRIAAAMGGTLLVRAVEALNVDVQRRLAAVAAAATPSLAAPDDAPTHALRVVATTVRPPSALVLDAALRQRLDALVVELPPLRDRAGDVATLAELFARRFGGVAPPMITASAAARLERHLWPGNVAELKLVMEGAVARASAGVVDVVHLGLDDVHDIEPARRVAGAATEP